MKYFTKRAPRQGFNVDCADFTNFDEFESKIKPVTKMIWFESPTNPMLNVVDIKSICKIAKSIAKVGVDEKASQKLYLLKKIFILTFPYRMLSL